MVKQFLQQEICLWRFPTLSGPMAPAGLHRGDPVPPITQPWVLQWGAAPMGALPAGVGSVSSCRLVWVWLGWVRCK